MMTMGNHKLTIILVIVNSDSIVDTNTIMKFALKPSARIKNVNSDILKHVNMGMIASSIN